MAIQLNWLGHSCFRVQAHGFTIVLDPFAPGSVPGYRDIDEKADLILCSHDHHDHNYREAVTLITPQKENPFTITTLSSFHDDQEGAQRGSNTITILECDSVRVAHMGDIGCMPGALALEKLSGVDALLLPVGGYYTVGPKEAKVIADAVSPRAVIPMHYRSDRFGYDVIGPVNEFLKLYDSYKTLDGSSVEITPDGPSGVVVLSY